MHKAILVTAMVLLVILAACKSDQLNAKPLSKTMPRAAQEQTSAPAALEEQVQGKTAAEAIRELQQQFNGGTTGATTTQGTKSLYPPAPTGVTGKDALKARTRSLYKQSTSQPVDADRDFGARYDSKSDLPKGYGNEGSAGE